MNPKPIPPIGSLVTRLHLSAIKPRGRQALALWLALIIAVLFGTGRWLVSASNPSGDLQIEVITAYNFVVDSNVESPSTYAPEAATIGAKICNDGTNDMTNVFAYVGNYANNTPGIYPSRAQPPLVGPLPGGEFALVHEGGSAGLDDATRYIGTLKAGECFTEYWLVSYPRLDQNGNTVTQGIKADDDLFLNYDIWASGTDGATSVTADQTNTAYMRNEISAAANKIWPNGDNKVPDAYLSAIQQLLGWDTMTPGGSSSAYPGELITTQGIWYDLGNVGFGFDNDHDGVPDHNAWLQPIGDPNSYDPGCFRLVRTYGIVIVKLQGGGEYLIPFVDQLYFENIPDNTGAVGLVFYQYAALDGVCSAGLSPYQEVASGFDNEKFSGDYGIGIPPLTSQNPTVTLDKTVNLATTTVPASLTYTLNFNNPGPVDVGNPDLGVPLVVQDEIPAGTTYVAGSASSSNTLPGTTTVNILYSHDGGTTWSITEAPASTVTNIQWWLSKSLAVGTSGTVRFQVSVPGAYPDPSVLNTGGLSFGNRPPIIEDTATTLILGNNAISGKVWEDNGASTDFADGQVDAGEANIPGATVTLYAVVNGVNTLYATTTTDGSGNYAFNNLSDGDYVVVVSTTLPGTHTGWTHTTPTSISVDDLGVSGDETRSGNNFGFAPALTIDKNLATATPAYENDIVTFTIDLTNRLPGNGTGTVQACTYTFWGQTEASQTSGGSGNGFFLNRQNAVGTDEPDGLVSTSAFANNADRVAATTFVNAPQIGTITSVEALFNMSITGAALSNDDAVASLYVNNDTTAFATTPITSAQMNVFHNAQGYLSWSVTGLRTWSWSDFAAGANIDLEFTAQKQGGTDGGTVNIDSIGFRVTTDQNCGGQPSTTIDPLPLTDTYDTSRLQFVSASPAPDSVSGGTITWNDLGPLYAGGLRTVTVNFRALQLTTTTATTNTATIGSAFFADGKPANGGTDSANVTITPTGSISGRIWSDSGTVGWVGTNGYEAGDSFIPGVTVELLACRNAGTLVYPGDPSKRCNQVPNSGTWDIVQTTTTDSTGSYLFSGLQPGFYRVQVVTTATQSAEADDNQNATPNKTPATTQVATGHTCGTCNNIWGNDTDLLSGTNYNPIDVAEDITNVNFGYTSPSLYGNVWEDIDGDGSKDAGIDLGISGVTVRLVNNTTNALITTTTTDSSGNYSFLGLSTSINYRVEVLTSSLPGGAATWTETAESDSTINDQIVAGTLTSGQVSGSHEFGFHHTGTSIIGDTLYYDYDGDGTQDASEEGIPNITVTLYKDNDNDSVIDTGTDPVYATTATNASGIYTFTGIPAGNYIVKVDQSDAQFPLNVLPTQDPDEAGVCVTCDGQSHAAGVNGTSSYLTHDYGFRPTGSGSIGDTIWRDMDGNGSQSGASETGIANVTVTLWVDLNGDGTYVQVASTVTDSSGHYLFSNLPNAAYQIRVNTVGNNLPTDVIGNTYTNTTGTLNAGVVTISQTIANNASINTVDFGFKPAGNGSIGDTVWYDYDGSGTQSGLLESGFAGVTVQLWYDQGGGNFVQVATTTTDSSGHYLFSGLPDGTYQAQIDIGDNSLQDVFGNNYIPTTGSLTGDVVSLGATITGGSTDLTRDFGFTALGRIGDTIFWDANQNGQQDWNENGINGVTVSLYKDADNNGSYETFVGTQVTDTDGKYLFSNLMPGKYQVSVGAITGNPPLTADPDADGDPCTGAPMPFGCDGLQKVTIYAGTNHTGADFGYQPPGVIGDFVWFDQDADGTKDSGEYGISGVLVNLYTDADGDGLIEAGDTVIGTQVTDPDGYYVFDNRPNGSYVVQIDPSNFLAGGALLNYVPSFDPDDDNPTPPVGCVTDDNQGCVTITNGSTDLTVDFGYTVNGNLTLSGTICLDDPLNDGVCLGTSGETDLSGIIVYLSNASGAVAQTTTDANGNYTFVNLLDDTYTVSISTVLPPLDTSNLTTQLGDTPASSIVETTSTARQVVPMNNTSKTDVDFAFAQSFQMDFGDLPLSYSTSLFSSPSGARHIIPAAGANLYLGTPPDAESNGTPTSGATGDGADEDGVTPINPNSWTETTDGGSVQVSVTGTGWLIGWIDFNNDGDFADATDMIVNQAVSTNTYTFSFDIPSGALANGALYSRFRLFPSQPGFPALAYSGLASNGEVEDFRFVVQNFDLALTKTLSPSQTQPINVGDDVLFVITVFNQGDQAAYNLQITDTLPAGFSLSASDTNGWTVVGSTATTTLAGPLAAGTSVTHDILLTATGAGSLANTAEISAGDNDAVAGNTAPADVDSVPDTDPTNDGTVKNDVVNENYLADPANNDQDDHDTETVSVQGTFDLALTKTLSPSQTLPITNGDDVLFVITVFNQGNVAGYNVQITDTLPAGFSLSASDTNGWTIVGSTATTTLTGPLAAGASVTHDILLTATSAGSLANTAEISAADDDNDPNNAPPTDADSVLDTDPTNDGTVKNDVVNEDYLADPANNDQDDHDAETVSVQPRFDIALTKTLSGSQTLPINIGDDVLFVITVFNQGDSAAYNIELTDTLPAGFSLSASDTNGWTVVGSTATTTLAGPLAAGASVTHDILLTATSAGSLANTAEISAADDDADPNNAPPTDADSVPDTDPTNDGTVKNDVVNEDYLADPANNDQDDHDTETVTVQGSFDLALTKTLSGSQSLPINVGDDVLFVITVFNQGNVAAYNVELTDTLPAGFSLSASDTNGWTVVGSTATTTLAGPLAAGASVTHDILLTATSAGSLANTAEISAADDDADPNNTAPTDTDSVPDTDLTNDGTVKNDVVNEDYLADPANNDQDDHDTEAVSVQGTFDLALTKTLSGAQTLPINVGDDVLFVITVFNQGNVAAYNIELTDTLPAGFSLSASDTNGWTVLGSTATTTLAGPLAAGASITHDILLTATSAGSLANTAEISAADDDTDPNNTTPTDTDSVPDTDPTNDGTVKNDVVNEDYLADPANNDQDDHDAETVSVQGTFDLALTKTLSGAQTLPINVGDDVLFVITIFNQGNQAAYNIELTDTLPAGFSLSASDTNGWTVVGSTATTTLAGPLAAGASVTHDILLTATSTGSLANTAEISAADDDTDPNNTAPTDTDSVPDTDPTNDGTVKNDVVNEDYLADPANNDQDDHDAETVTVQPNATSTLAKSIQTTSNADTTGTDVGIGEVITYHLEIGLPLGTLTPVVIDDNLPVGLAYVNGSANVVSAPTGTGFGAPTVTSTGGSGDDLQISFASVNITDNTNPLVIEYQALVLDVVGNVDGTTLDNSATLTVATLPPTTPETTQVTVVEPDLSIVKTFIPDTANDGDTVTVQLEVTNNGNATAYNVLIEDPLDNTLFGNFTEGTTPAGFTYSTQTAGTTTLVRYTGGAVNAGETLTLTFDVTLSANVTPGQTIDNTASVVDGSTQPGRDPNARQIPTVDGDDTLTIDEPDLTVDKSHTGSFTVGQQGDFTITVSNSGTGTAPNTIMMVDTLPAELDYVDAIGTNWTCGYDNTTREITCTYPGPVGPQTDLPDITVTVTPTTDTGSPFQNSVVVSTTGETITNNNTDTDSVNVNPEPLADLTIDKSHSGDFTVGQLSVFHLDVTNIGDATADGPITVTDQIDTTAFDFVAASGTNWTCTETPAGSNFLSCQTADNLGSGASLPSIDVQVTPLTTTGSPFTNTADVSAPSSNETDTSNNSDDDQIIVVAAPEPDLAITKSHTGNFVVGTQGSFTIDIENVGNSVTTDPISVSDTLPTGLTFVSGGGTDWMCSNVGQDVTCDYSGAALNPTDTTSFTIDVMPDAAAVPSVTNTATVDTKGDNNDNNDSDDDDVTVTDQGAPDLSIDKHHSGSFVVGSDGDFTITVHNGGTGATTDTITVVDPLPADLSYVSASGNGWTCSYDSGSHTVTCTNNGPLDPNTDLPDITITVNPTSAANSPLTNTATVDTTGDADDSNDSDDDDVTIDTVSGPDLSIDKHHNSNFVLDEEGVFLLTVENVGSADTTNTIRVTDSVPNRLVVQSVEGNGWDCGASSGQDVNCTHPGPLASGDSLPNIRVHVIPNRAGDYTNTAHVSTRGDDNDANDSDDDDVTVDRNPSPDLTIEKHHDGNFHVGDEEEYTLTVTNVGSARANSEITVTDELPEELDFVDADGDGWDCDFHNGTHTLVCKHDGPVAIGSDLPEITLTVRPTEGSTFTNRAEVDSDDDSNDDNNEARDRTVVVANRELDLTIDKSHDGDFHAGNEGEYHLVVSNVGNQPTTGGVTVTDYLPDEMSYVSADGDGWSCDGDDHEVSCNYTGNDLPLDPDESLPTITLIVDIDEDAVGTFNNRAEVDTLGDHNRDNDDDTDRTRVTNPGIYDPPSLIKTVNDDGYPELEWTMLIVNPNNVPVAVTLTDNRPEATTVLPNTVRCEPGNGTTVDRCEYDAGQDRVVYEGTIGPNSDLTIIFRTSVPDGLQQVHNTARLFWDSTGDGDPDQDIDPLSADAEWDISGRNSGGSDEEDSGEAVASAAQGSVTIIKGVLPPFANAGDNVQWTITVTNGSASGITNGSVTDTVPDTLAILSINATSGAAQWNGQAVTWTGNLAAGESATITVQTRLRADVALPNVIVNNACLTFDGSTGQRCDDATLMPTTELPATGESPLNALRLPLLLAVLASGFWIGIRLVVKRTRR